MPASMRPYNVTLLCAWAIVAKTPDKAPTRRVFFMLSHSSTRDFSCAASGTILPVASARGRWAWDVAVMKQQVRCRTRLSVKTRPADLPFRGAKLIIEKTTTTGEIAQSLAGQGPDSAVAGAVPANVCHGCCLSDTRNPFEKDTRDRTAVGPRLLTALQQTIAVRADDRRAGRGYTTGSASPSRSFSLTEKRSPNLVARPSSRAFFICTTSVNMICG